MRRRCRLAAAEAPHADMPSHGITPEFALTHGLPREDVLDASAKSADSLTQLVPHGSADKVFCAKNLPIPVI